MSNAVSPAVPANRHPRTVIVCLPPDHAADWFTASLAVADHLHGSAVLQVRFPVRHRRILGWLATRWTARWLLAALRRGGAVSRAAGGRLGRLDLRLAGQAAWLDAAARWAVWRKVTGGLRQPAPWETYLRRHQAKPDRLSPHEARRMFLRQPAVAAMLAHNAIPAQRHLLDPDELDAYQAGPHAYATRHMLAAVAGDAMLTADGRWLEPASRRSPTSSPTSTAPPGTCTHCPATPRSSPWRTDPLAPKQRGGAPCQPHQTPHSSASPSTSTPTRTTSSACSPATKSPQRRTCN